MRSRSADGCSDFQTPVETGTSPEYAETFSSLHVYYMRRRCVCQAILPAASMHLLPAVQISASFAAQAPGLSPLHKRPPRQLDTAENPLIAAQARRHNIVLHI